MLISCMPEELSNAPKETGAEQSLPKNPAPPAQNTDGEPAKRALTPEEQMALFEKDLKENDWGHQPC
jgi:hypothetical protein